MNKSEAERELKMWFERLEVDGWGNREAFNKDAIGRRSGIIMGEGMWRWRMESTLHSGNSQIFDALLCRTVQYLDSRDDVRRFRVKSNKIFEDSDRVMFSAQVYNASLNPTTDSDISLVITNARGENFDYDFSIENESYKLDCGRMPAGEYTWVAQTIIDGKIEKLSGGFVVSEVIAEFISESANHDLLKRLALKTGGEFLGSINTEDIDVESITLDVDSKVNKRYVIHEFTDRLELITKPNPWRLDPRMGYQKKARRILRLLFKIS